MEEYAVRDLFPTPVYMTQMPRSLTTEEYEFVIQKSESVFENEYAGTLFNYQSTDNFILENDELKDIKSFIQSHVNNYKDEIMSVTDNVDFYITQSWINYTNENQSHHQHYHPNSILSGVLYLATDEDDSITFVKETRYNTINFSKPKTTNSYNCELSTLKVGNGLLVLFPSHLLHRVYRKNGKNTRISLAFNTFFKGEISLPQTLEYLKI